MRDIKVLTGKIVHDDTTYRHMRRVEIYAARLAGEIGIENSSMIEAIRSAALLHDIGKLAVPERILTKPDKLTRSERETMKQHVELGVEMLVGLGLTDVVISIIRAHHENWNGTGYPMGLKGREIPLGARVLSIVDAFDAMTSDRPYRPGMSGNASLQILLHNRGIKYDPAVVDSFARMCLRVGATLTEEVTDEEGVADLPSYLRGSRDGTSTAVPCTLPRRRSASARLASVNSYS